MKKQFLLLLVLGFSASTLAQPKQTIDVYKSPDCGCCGRWAALMQQQGYRVIIHNERDMPAVKARLNVPAKVQACHSATLGRYVIEGHVPAADIKALLSQHPAGVYGIAVAGMPRQGPGMGDPNLPPQSFNVTELHQDGRITVMHRY